MAETLTPAGPGSTLTPKQLLWTPGKQDKSLVIITLAVSSVPITCQAPCLTSRHNPQLHETGAIMASTPLTWKLGDATRWIPQVTTASKRPLTSTTLCRTMLCCYSPLSPLPQSDPLPGRSQVPRDFVTPSPCAPRAALKAKVERVPKPPPKEPTPNLSCTGQSSRPGAGVTGVTGVAGIHRFHCLLWSRLESQERV